MRQPRLPAAHHTDLATLIRHANMRSSFPPDLLSAAMLKATFRPILGFLPTAIVYFIWDKYRFKKNEYEADLVGTMIATEAGVNPVAAITALIKVERFSGQLALWAEAQRQMAKRIGLKPVPLSFYERIQRLISHSHPASRKRLARLEELSSRVREHETKQHCEWPEPRLEVEDEPSLLAKWDSWSNRVISGQRQLQHLQRIGTDS